MVKQQPTSAEGLSHFVHTPHSLSVCSPLDMDVWGSHRSLWTLKVGVSGVFVFTAELDKHFQLTALRGYCGWAIPMATRMNSLLFLSPLSVPYSPDAPHKLQTWKTLLEILTAKHSGEVRDREGIATALSLSLCLCLPLSFLVLPHFVCVFK